MLLTVKALIDLFPAKVGNVEEETTIKHVMTDSRNKVVNSLFVPIIGETFDGHNFIYHAIEQGAVVAIWDEKVPLPKEMPVNFVFFLVPDIIKALQRLAKYYRDEVNPLVIGITGSNGKTTTKNLLISVLKTKFITHGTAGNFNNHIGLPLTILEMERDTEVLVLEMGMSDFDEINILTKIASPDHAIITNIGESHIQFLGSRAGIVKAKLEICNGLKEDGLLIVDGDDEQLLAAIQDEVSIVTCGFKKNNECLIEEVSMNTNETTFTLGDKSQFTIPLLGKHHAKNAAFTVAIGRKLGVSDININEGLQAVTQSGMRFELMTGKNGVTIINDAYNASPTSVKAAIDVVKELKSFKRKILILGDVLELGDESKRLHLSIADAIEYPITCVFTVGEDAAYISAAIQNRGSTINSKHFSKRKDLIEAIQPYLDVDTLLLFKASRGMVLEEIVKKII